MSPKVPLEMHQKTKSLAGVRVLVGRARHQAGALAHALREQGAQILEIPFIEIREPHSFQPLDSALKNLSGYDWLILTSVNGVEAMWERLVKLGIESGSKTPGANARDSSTSAAARLKSRPFSFANMPFVSAVSKRLRVAAIGPATKKAIEDRGVEVDVVPKEYVAESVVRSLHRRVKGKRVLLVRAKVARDVIPRELRKAGAHVDVVEAYETVVPKQSRARLRAALRDSKRRPHVVTFTSSSTVRNFVTLLGARGAKPVFHGRDRVLTASIGPVTSSTLRESRLPVDIQAKEFTIPGLVQAIVEACAV